MLIMNKRRKWTIVFSSIILLIGLVNFILNIVNSMYTTNFFVWLILCIPIGTGVIGLYAVIKKNNKSLAYYGFGLLALIILSSIACTILIVCGFIYRSGIYFYYLIVGILYFGLVVTAYQVQKMFKKKFSHRSKKKNPLLTT